MYPGSIYPEGDSLRRCKPWKLKPILCIFKRISKITIKQILIYSTFHPPLYNSTNKSHKTPVLDTRMHLTHPHTNSPIAILCFISGHRNSPVPSTHHYRCSTSLWTCCRWCGRCSLKAEYFDHPFIPDFAVVGLSVHCYDDFAVVGDVERSLLWKNFSMKDSKEDTFWRGVYLKWEVYREPTDHPRTFGIHRHWISG